MVSQVKNREAYNTNATECMHPQPRNNNGQRSNERGDRGNLIRVQKNARSKNKEGPKSTTQHNIAGLQVHLAATTPNKVPKNGYPTTKSSECPPAKNYALHLQSLSTAISTAQYARPRSDFYFFSLADLHKTKGLFGVTRL